MARSCDRPAERREGAAAKRRKIAAQGVSPGWMDFEASSGGAKEKALASVSFLRSPMFFRKSPSADLIGQ